MALHIQTQQPNRVLLAFKKAIDENKIRTWAYDADGDLYHTPEQWRSKAWMRPFVATGELRFGILGKTDTVTWPVYGVLHGRLSEEFLSHFSGEIGEIKVMSKPEFAIDHIAK